MTTLEDYLKQDAHLYPDKIALTDGKESLSYRQLLQRVLDRSHDFSSQAHHPVVFRSQQDINTIIEYLAIHLAGAVAMPLEKDMPDDVYNKIKAQAEPFTLPDSIADILYTTGTTGKSKAVMISHATIIANGDNLWQAQKFQNDLTFIICGPLNHIGSLSKLYPVIMCGASIYLLEGLKDLNRFYQALDQIKGKAATFLVPASIRTILALSDKRLKNYSDKIDFIETGAAAISQRDMLRLCSLLPKSRLYNTYASTETGIIATYDFSNGEIIEGCLGPAMPHSNFFITTEGTIACQGETLMSGYLNDEAATQAILRDNTLYTSDLGFIDSKGMLHLQGRNDDVINTGGFKVAPTEIENVVLSLPYVEDCIVVKASHPIMGDVLKLLIVLKPGAIFDKKAIAQYIASKLERHKVPFYYEQVENIHRTFNGKLDRKYYAAHP